MGEKEAAGEEVPRDAFGHVRIAELNLIRRSAAVGAKAALDGVSGVAGMDEDKEGEMSVIAFPRIKGGKPFDIETPWFTELLESIGQPNGLNCENHTYLRTNAGIRKSL